MAKGLVRRRDRPEFTDVQELGLASKLVDNKVCAIDETWSGVQMVIRLKDR